MLQTEYQENVIKKRLEVDERPLKRLSRRVLQLAKQSKEDNIEHLNLDTLHNDFDIFDHTIRRLSLLVKANEQETMNYEREMSAIGSKYEEARQDLIRMKAQLEAEKQLRQDRATFDIVARDIHACAPKSRTSQHNTISKLVEEVKELEMEKTSYNETWQLRKTGFEDIMSKLSDLQREISGEKADAELRDAAEESDEDDGALSNHGSELPVLSISDDSLETTAETNITALAARGVPSIIHYAPTEMTEFGEHETEVVMDTSLG